MTTELDESSGGTFEESVRRSQALELDMPKHPEGLRPLRRTGATPDVLWDEGKPLVRRSHTRGDSEMIGTKTGGDDEISVPPERRSFQDLCRTAEVKDVVARSICGQATEAM